MALVVVAPAREGVAGAKGRFRAYHKQWQDLSVPGPAGKVDLVTSDPGAGYTGDLPGTGPLDEGVILAEWFASD
jgi:hypothetical protein